MEMNADSYSDYEETIERKAASQVPPLRQGGITGSPNDPSVSNILDMILAKKEPTPVPMACNMAQRQAAVLIADELFYNLQGKAILQGIYHSDLIIPTDPTLAPQLLFFFIIETDVSEPFHSLNVQVTLPGNPPVSNVVFVPPPQLITPHIQPGRTRFYF